MADPLSMVASLLRTAFPDPAIQISASAVEASLRALSTVAKTHGIALPHGVDLGHGVPDLSPHANPSDDARVVDYWVGLGTHTRTQPIKSSFTGHLPMVRVLVEDGWETQPIATKVGNVYAGDHKLFSFTESKKYLDEVAEALGVVVPTATRVEVVTPARAGGARFGAIGVYVFSTDSGPFAYALEAGMATGEARVLYFAPTLTQAILRRSGYVPTPFSKADSYYRGKFVLDARHAPKSLEVEVRSDLHAEAHMSVHVAYEKTGQPECVFPALLTLQAACRVAAIAEASKVPFPDMGPLTPLFAALGRDQYAWTQKPGAT